QGDPGCGSPAARAWPQDQRHGSGPRHEHGTDHSQPSLSHPMHPGGSGPLFHCPQRKNSTTRQD
ncbi:hypothetical protein CJ672_10940, partial [Arcobacter cryaerophilus gv. occultus]